MLDTSHVLPSTTCGTIPKGTDSLSIHVVSVGGRGRGDGREGRAARGDVARG